ncbi:hypothetical protein LOTGIDRAFT_142073 [Lottia gigantea]|uniref:Transmembrane protein 135 N-terminal domain-containing protein n=1 Tax=Lottia gigantea TaxID=225164 RepID=V4AVR2_LOTGI|nr:hypothetical protein LOTGIDRAFT_142073 [Lottia gigantea]ESO99145.1 hypothetical protein LOTGIDRAFT_142073 [Lottia gigantea]
MKTLDYTCYELGHTWDPYCTTAALNVGKTVFREALKMYGSLYLVAALVKKRGKDYYLKKFLPETLRSSLFLAANGGLFVASFCFWRKVFGRTCYFTVGYLPTLTAALIAILIERKSRYDHFYFINISRHDTET